mgnify:CR=1 FL=1
MVSPGAQRPPARSTGGRADRATSRISPNSNARPHVEGPACDHYPSAVALQWFEDHGMTPPARRCDRWVLTTPRPATFAELVELGAIELADLAVPVSAVDLAGGF